VNHDLVVATVQWLPAPGQAEHNLATALSLVDQAARRGASVVVLPELWPCGADPASMADDARAAAEPLSGPRLAALGRAAQAHHLWLVAGSVPELADGRLFNTAPVLDPEGCLVAAHRKCHLYPPFGEPGLFDAGDRLTCFAGPATTTIGLVVGFEGDFPEVARALGHGGAQLVVSPCATPLSGSARWDLLAPAAALANGQWWVQADQGGTHGTSTLLGASRILAPTGTVVAEAARALPGTTPAPEILVHRVDLDAGEADETAELLAAGRRPELYV